MTEVLLFARARELAGTRHLRADGSTVDQVVAAVAAQFGDEFAELCRTCTVVVDGETVPRSEFATAAPGSELAILPPVSGGSHDDGGPDTAVRVVVITVSDRASAAGGRADRGDGRCPGGRARRRRSHRRGHPAVV